MCCYHLEKLGAYPTFVVCFLKYCRTCCWRHVSLASNNYGSSRQSLCWRCFPRDYSFSSRLSLQATQGLYIW